MVHEDDVIRDPLSTKGAQTLFNTRLKQFAGQLKSYQPPDREALEQAVEKGTKCGKCAGGVRAVLFDAKPSEAFAYDLEILVSLNCRDAACAWTARQWRPWVRTKPLEL